MIVLPQRIVRKKVLDLQHEAILVRSSNIKTLIAHFEVPKIYSQIICKYVHFAITIARTTHWVTKQSNLVLVD